MCAAGSSDDARRGKSEGLADGGRKARVSGRKEREWHDGQRQRWIVGVKAGLTGAMAFEKPLSSLLAHAERPAKRPGHCI